MGIIKCMEVYMTEKEKKRREEEVQRQYTHSMMQKAMLGMNDELNMILGGMPRINGMQVISEECGLCPQRYATDSTNHRALFFFRWSKSSDGAFGQMKLWDIYSKLVEHLGLTEMKVRSNISQANEAQMKKRYFFLLRGMRVLEVDEDAFNLYICIETYFRGGGR